MGFALAVAFTAPVRENEIVPETELLTSVEDPVVNAILEVKAWCKLAAEKNKGKMDEGDDTRNAIAEVVKMMAQEHASHNFVTQFGEAMGQVKKKAQRGMSKYILAGINKAVLEGKSVFTRDGTNMILNAAVLGFTDTPPYFHHFEVDALDFTTETHTLNHGDAAKAVAEWVEKGEHTAYAKNLAIEEAKIKAEEDKVEKAKEWAAQEAIHASFEANSEAIHLTHSSKEAVKIGAMNPLSGAGAKASKALLDSLPDKKVLTPEEIHAKAMAQAKLDVQEASKKANIGTIVQELEDAAEAAATP